MVFNDKVAIVTGVASGIGKAVCERFIEEGVKVVGADLNEAGLKKMEEAAPGMFKGIRTNVALQEDNEKMIDLAVSEFGHADILINNAGVIDQGQTVEHMENDIWDRCMKVNLYGPMYAMRYFIHLNRTEGRPCAIVSTSSVGGNAHPLICGAAYAASKAGLIQLTRHAAYAYGKDNIRTNVICVGAAPSTGMAQTFTHPDMEGMSFSMAVNKASVRNAEPVELANAILYLASEEVSYVNGAILNVDGGWSCF